MSDANDFRVAMSFKIATSVGVRGTLNEPVPIEPLPRTPSTVGFRGKFTNLSFSEFMVLIPWVFEKISLKYFK